MELVLRALGLDVLPADADAQVDQAFRLSGLMSGQVAVSTKHFVLQLAINATASASHRRRRGTCHWHM